MAELGDGDGDEAGVVLVELHLTQNAELREEHEVGVVLFELHRTRKVEPHDGDEASIVLVESNLEGVVT